jgi:para-aminobenzoate synthetase component 1
MFLNRANTIELMNEYGRTKFPFFFLISYNMEQNLVLRLNEIDPEIILYDFGNGNTNALQNYKAKEVENIDIIPVEINNFRQAFHYVQDNLKHGNSYLLNLTFPTEILTDIDLIDIFYQSNAKYKLFLKDSFVCFSPEIFVKIEDDIISSYPMKGTISSEIPNSLETILNDPKETAEHYTIVDLIRNDLSMVAEDVEVERFRYHDKITSRDKELLQISSKVSGKMSIGYLCHLGEILFKLLPAGSVTGAPKKKTLEIIEKAEQYDRGFYTGVFGYFDGQNLDSAVTIRYIEKYGDKYFYKSGGGITVNSNLELEYQELKDKIYVPTS